MKREVKPNKEEIKRLRLLADLTQKEVISKGLTLSYRQYQRAEGGKKLSVMDLERIATFYDDYLKKNIDHKKNVYVDDIILDEKKDISEKETGIFSYKIYLHKIDSYEQLSNIIKQSKYQKIFYPNSPDKEQTEIIKEIVREFKKVYDEYNSNPKNKNTDDYENIEKELKALDVNSNFSSVIKKLSEKKLYLYANNFVHSYIGWYYHDESGMLVSDVLSKNYAIFCFKDFKTTAITFKYETDYPKEKLIKLVKEKPWSVDSAEYSHDAESADEDFEEKYKEYLKDNNTNFDKAKVTLVKTDIEDLVDEDQLHEYVNEEINKMEEEGDIMFPPDPSDYIDPKDD